MHYISILIFSFFDLVEGCVVNSSVAAFCVTMEIKRVPKNLFLIQSLLNSLPAYITSAAQVKTGIPKVPTVMYTYIVQYNRPYMFPTIV